MTNVVHIRVVAVRDKGQTWCIIICFAALALSDSFAAIPLVALRKVLDDPRTAGESFIDKRGWALICGSSNATVQQSPNISRFLVNAVHEG